MGNGASHDQSASQSVFARNFQDGGLGLVIRIYPDSAIFSFITDGKSRSARTRIGYVGIGSLIFMKANRGTAFQVQVAFVGRQTGIDLCRAHTIANQQDDVFGMFGRERLLGKAGEGNQEYGKQNQVFLHCGRFESRF